MTKTLFDKVWDAHVVTEFDDGGVLLYIDRHLVHEVTSPQAFEGLRLTNRKVRHPERTFAVLDHNIPTVDRRNIRNPISRKQVNALEQNARDFGISYYGLDSDRQGIVHVIGPELGITLPGMTLVCGDSHTSTHGAFGSLAFGIGTSEVEHVLATQCLVQSSKPGNYLIWVDGTLHPGLTSKDIILRIIREIGTGGGTGHVFEYAGPAVRNLTMEQRMTICNMSIEAGARAGMVAPDETTFAYVSQDRPFAPKGALLAQAIEYWKTLASDAGAQYDKQLLLNVDDLPPQVSWGTNPGMVTDVTGMVPGVNDFLHSTPDNVKRALDYMGLESGQKMTDIKLDVVFLGSCTNSRIEDLRLSASILQGKKVHPDVHCYVVPGSMQVKEQAIREGLDEIFIAAGCDWRDAGCSMCLGMNPDQLLPQQRCASTSNRNFEGRQGKGGRTHLCSPLTAAAAAVEGRFVDVRDYV